MGDLRRCFALTIACLSFAFPCFNVSADDHISILEQNVKAVASVASGKYVKIAWTVKLRNEKASPVTCDVTVDFIDANEKSLETANKTTTLDANETKRVSDTVLIRSDVANQIASCLVSILDK